MQEKGLQRLAVKRVILAHRQRDIAVIHLIHLAAHIHTANDLIDIGVFCRQAQLLTQGSIRFDDPMLQQAVRLVVGVFKGCDLDAAGKCHGAGKGLTRDKPDKGTLALHPLHDAAVGQLLNGSIHRQATDIKLSGKLDL